MFTLFTYITPILRDVTGVSPQNVSGVLLLCGVGLTIGNLLGGRLAEWKLLPSLMGIFAVLAAFSFTSAWLWPAILTVVVWGMVSFAAGTPLQARVVSQAGDAPSLASTLNIVAFNLGNAIGAWLGGRGHHGRVVAAGHSAGGGCCHAECAGAHGVHRLAGPAARAQAPVLADCKAV